MIIEFKTSEQDFLDFQLFTASQSDRIKRKMINGWIFLTLILGIISACFYFKYNIIMAVYFGIAAIVSGLFYPMYFRWRYKKHYKTYIKENYSNRFEKTEYIEIKDEAIFMKDSTGEATLNISEIDKVDETEKHFFIKIKAGTYLIIPKYKIQNPDEVRDKFESLGFTVNKITNIKWK
ncbi:MAG: YcxB family protein [Bacteroidales bacterium]|jgi:hypothetical protein|nr:YcxB family protein [Bacteroidales bacterium]